MLRLKGASKLKALILHPFKSKAVTIVTLSETRLCLGMEVDGKGKKRLVIFTHSKQGFVTVGTIYYNLYYPSTRCCKGNPLCYDEIRGISERGRFDEDQTETREELKERLSSLGFDPNAVDTIWPT